MNEIELDSNDRRILQYLQRDCRASVSDIARDIGMPRDSVHYRIQRLIKHKVILHFHAAVDPVKLGHPVYSFVHITLHNLDEAKEKQFYAYLQEHRNINYVARTTGNYDCIISVIAKDLRHFDNIIRDIRREFSEIIKDYTTSSIIDEPKYDRMAEVIEPRKPKN